MKLYLGGTVDGVFLVDVAEELLKRKEMLKVPVMLGLTNHEFGWILPHVTDSKWTTQWHTPLNSFCLIMQDVDFVSPVHKLLVFCLLSPLLDFRPSWLAKRHEQGDGAVCDEPFQPTRGQSHIGLHRNHTIGAFPPHSTGATTTRLSL